MKGERENVLKALDRYAVPEEVSQEEQPVFSNEEEAVRWVMENSDDINEVLGTYESVRDLQVDAALPRWQQELQGIKINPESFYRHGDRNLSTTALRRGWLSKDGRSIDEVAHDLSNYGIEVTTQDIVDFMLENPSGRVRQKSGELDALRQRFSELATKAAGVKIGKPDSPTGKLFIENLRTSNDMEQLRNEINDAQRAEKEVLRSMAEQREAEKGVGDDDIKPIGQGFFGNIYDQFRGRAKDAIDFLMNRKEGEAIGALHHPQVGDIDLVWGNDKAGLMKIAKKHPEMLDDLQGKIDNMEVVSSSDNRIVLESPTDKAVVSKNVFDEEGKQWLLTAYEKKNANISGSSIDIEPKPEGKQNGTAPLQNESVSSSVKDTESLGENQEADVYTESIKAAEAAVDVSPTQAQKDAGNYKKGHIKLDGYDITIENPKGSERSGIDADGNSWSTKMNNTYGYIRGTKGVDGDHIDVFLSDTPQGGNVYVVDQVKEDGTFDEHKVMYGFSSLDEARDAYLSNYSPGWKGLGTITEVSKDEFKKWVDSSKRKTKPFSEYKNVKVEGSQIDSPLFRSIDNNTEEEQEIIDRNRQDGVSATDNTGEFSRENDDIRFRNIEDVNRRFNEELDAFEKGEQKGDLHLGLPGDVLLASGLNNTEIYITPKTLKEHFGKHGLNVDDIKDLPSALNNPLLVYEWGDKAKSLVVITNIEHDKGRITAAIKLERSGNRLEVNELASIHPKDNRRFINDMTNAKRGGLKEALRYVSDKKKALDWLGLVPPKGTASLTKQELDIANVIKDFENPTLLEGEISSTIDGLSDELGVKVNRVKSRKDLPEGIQRQMKNGRYPGLFDPKTGEVWLVG